MTIPKGGLTVRYQGIVCLPDFEFSLEASTRATSGFVRMAIADLGAASVRDLKIDPSSTGVDTLFGFSPDPPVAGGGRLWSRGTLEVSEEYNDVGNNNDLTVRKRVFQNVYVDEEAMRADFPTDNQSEVLTIRLASFQYMWPRRGSLTGWFNVPLRSPPSAQGRRGTVTDDNPGELDPSMFVPGSLRNGQLWTLRQFLEERVFPALPTSPALYRLPRDAETAIPYDHRYIAQNPSKVLERLLVEFDLTPGPRFDGSMGLYRRDEGMPEEDGSPVPDGLIAQVETTVSHHYPPIVVEVVGPPILQEVRLDLEPVGEVRGEIVPLGEALQAFGMGRPEEGATPQGAPAGVRIPEIGRLLMIPRQQRAAAYPDLAEDALKEFDRWAYRWFRIVSTSLPRSSRLPMFDVPFLGSYRPIKAFAETAERINVASLFDPDRRTRLRSVDASTQAAAQAVLTGLDAQLDGGEGLLRKSLRKRAEQIIQRTSQALQETGPRSPVVVVNQPYREVTSGFQVDRENGVIKFDRVVGHVFPDSQTEAQYTSLVFPVRAEVIFAHEKKPNPDRPMTLADHYVSWWGRDEDGKIVMVGLPRITAASRRAMAS